jgi:hypothetical protein
VRKRGTGVLEQKAALYEQLKNGQIKPEAAKQAGFLVDFDQVRGDAGSSSSNDSSRRHSSSGRSDGGSNCLERRESHDLLEGSSHGLSEVDGHNARPSQFTLKPGEVEIEDEFGREVRLWMLGYISTNLSLV